MTTNGELASRARVAVEESANLVGAVGEPLEDNITDLLANLMHLCEQEGLSFRTLSDRALMHYTAEQSE